MLRVQCIIIIYYNNINITSRVMCVRVYEPDPTDDRCEQWAQDIAHRAEGKCELVLMASLQSLFYLLHSCLLRLCVCVWCIIVVIHHIYVATGSTWDATIERKACEKGFNLDLFLHPLNYIAILNGIQNSFHAGKWYTYEQLPWCTYYTYVLRA